VEGCSVASVPAWLAAMFEEQTGTFSPDCRSEFAGCDPVECGL
jgi:hypothetical protein